MSHSAHPFDAGGVHTPTSRTVGSSTQASFALHEVQGCVVVAAAGELDICTSPRLREALTEAVRRSDHVIIDLTGVRFLDSTAMAVLVEALHQDHHGDDGRLCLVGPAGMVARALEITGLTRMFRVYPSVEQAAGAVA